MQGLFRLGERQRACSSRHVAAAALLFIVVLLQGCSDVALPSEAMPASGPDPGYNNLIASHFKDIFKKSCILRCIRHIDFSLGTLVQGLGLDDLRSLRG